MSDATSEAAILRRILKKAGLPGLVEALVSTLSLSDLQSLLLHVFRRRAAALRPADLLRQYAANRFVKPAGIGPVETMAFDSLAFSLLPAGFEAVELSPVAPLGACSVLGPVDQNNVLTTVRATEVLADPTNLLALECARRRRSDPAAPVRLACSQRLVRAQRFSGPASFAHFRLLGLCSAAPDAGNRGFEVAAAVEHVDFYLRLIAAASRLGCEARSLRVALIPFSEPMRALARDAIRGELIRLHPGAACGVEAVPEQTRDYYRGLRFQVFAVNRSGEEYFLADGGLTDWTRKLLNSRKERLMTSGIGSERFLVCFRGGSGRSTFSG